MSWQKERAKEAGDLERYCRDLEIRYKKAIKALSEIAQGVGRKPSFMDGGDKASFMMNHAAVELREIGELPLSRKPRLYWAE